MSDLFPEAVQDSPRLAWLKKHGLHTWFTPGLVGDEECPETGETIKPWTCCNADDAARGSIGSDNAAVGDTEEEACLEYCLKFKLKHWTLEP